MEEKDIKNLLDKYRAGTASEAEIAMLESWYLQHTEDGSDLLSAEERLDTLNNVWANLDVRTKGAVQRRLWPRIAAAASIVIGLSVAGYFLIHKGMPQQQLASVQKPDLLPGSNQATLTLPNGKKIILTKGLNGKLAQLGNTSVQVTSGDAIAYTTTDHSLEGKIEYNTLTTIAGQQSPYPLVLADGSKVWLNAKSSVTFPTAFNGRERVVVLKGEAYFEVAHHSNQPFKVKVNDQVIEDISTHFNINAYEDEPVLSTTLLEGKVKISTSTGKMVTLDPGQQADIKAGKIVVNSNVNLNAIIAWRSNMFQFTGADIKTVMRQFARWYDVDIEYKGTMPENEFAGKISRNVKASEVFESLKRYQVNLKIEGRKVIVSSTP